MAIDPGGDPSRVVDFLKQESLTLTHILNTHFHLDHIYGNAALAKTTSAPILANPEDEFLLGTEIGGGGFMGLPKVPDFDYSFIKPGSHTFVGALCQAISTPGHTPGSLSFYFPEAGILFAGDVLFRRGVGRTDFPGGNWETLLESIRDGLFSLPPETVVYSGHGDPTTIGEETANNPYFTDFSF